MPTLIHFTATWAERICGPHRAQVVKAADMLGSNVVECDIDQNHERVRLYGPANVPAVAIEGIPESLVVGAASAEVLTERLRGFLDPST